MLQDVQSQNDYGTTKLSVMGYLGDVLRAQFHPNILSKRRRDAGSATVANTRERQVVLAAAHTHGKKFFVTGGKHVTSNNMFIEAELIQRKVEAAEREKEKRSQVEYHVRCKAALPIINCLENELENNVWWLKSKELEVLLRWKGVPVLTMENVANRRILYQQFAEGGAEERGIPAPWTEIDKAGLTALRDGPINICDTMHGQFEEGRGAGVPEDDPHGKRVVPAEAGGNQRSGCQQ
jgi:hypothetical protein